MNVIEDAVFNDDKAMKIKNNMKVWQIKSPWMATLLKWVSKSSTQCIMANFKPRSFDVEKAGEARVL